MMSSYALGSDIGESKYDRQLPELDVVTKRINFFHHA